MTAPFDIKEYNRRMDGALEVLRKELGGLRTGRASVSLLEPVQVEAYGNRMPLNQVGSVNVPVVCAGVHVVPGDVVVADDDGVVIVPRAKASAVAKAGVMREEKEAANRMKLVAGALGLDLYGMRKALAAKGLRIIDGPVDYGAFEPPANE